MRYLSACSGIEAATVAWHPLGWEPVAFSEIEAFPCAVLTHHYPTVPNWGDMTRFHEWPDATFDVLVGGTPCQSFSVAGLRKGLADPRGNLALTYLAILDRYRPRWCVWENVPGVLSADRGRALGAFLGGLGHLGYGFAYRVLDAQYFGLAQRRARVFVVGHLGDWRRAAAVFFERESLSGHPPPSREAGERTTYSVAPSLGASGRGFSRSGETRGQDCVIPERLYGADAPCGCWARDAWHRTHGMKPGETCANYVAHSLRADGFDASEDGTGRGTPIVPIDLRQASRGEKITNNRAHGSGSAPGHGVGGAGDPAFTVSEREQAIAFDARQYDVIQHGEKTGPLDTDGHTIAVAFRSDAGRAGVAKSPSPDAAGRVRLRDPGFNVYEELAPTLDASAPHGVGHRMQVRRLTPRECERLQGFPDDYTLIPYRGKPAADGPRYKALGNSMAVPVMRWIGKRIALVEEATA